MGACVEHTHATFICQGGFGCCSCISLVTHVCVKMHSACQFWVKRGSMDPRPHLPPQICHCIIIYVIVACQLSLLYLQRSTAPCLLDFWHFILMLLIAQTVICIFLKPYSLFFECLAPPLSTAHENVEVYACTLYSSILSVLLPS